MPKPNFFIVGAAKCGTTGMKYYLHQHPDIFMAAATEINHFIRDFDIGPSQDEAWYLRHFEAAGDARVIGEKSVWHLFSKTAATDIKAFNPDARILIMLRNPVEMIHALHSQFLYGRNEDIKNFAHALAAEDDRRCGRCMPEHAFNKPALIYRDTVAYTDQVARYFEVFGRDAVQVIIYDDFKMDSQGEVRKTLEFLGVDASFIPEIKVVNANKKLRSLYLREFINKPPASLSAVAHLLLPKATRRRVKAWLRAWNVESAKRETLDPALRDKLMADFEPEIERLSALLGRDLSHWCRVVPVPAPTGVDSATLAQNSAH